MTTYLHNRRSSIGLRALRQRGAAMAETLVVFPILLLLGLGMVQMALIFEAKATLNYAALLAARQGAMFNEDPDNPGVQVSLEPDAMLAGVQAGLLPIYAKDGAMSESELNDVQDDIRNNTLITVVNPTHEAFQEFGVGTCGGVSGECFIPNANLRGYTQVPDPAGASGINIQDANLLRIRVVHNYELQLPLIRGIINAAVETLFDPDDAPYHRWFVESPGNPRIPIMSTATVRMQSPAMRYTTNEDQIATISDVDSMF